jgi:hypothetical protein
VQINLTINADTPEEFRLALEAVIAGLPVKVANAPVTDYTVTAIPVPVRDPTNPFAPTETFESPCPPADEAVAEVKAAAPKTRKSKKDAEPIVEAKVETPAPASVGNLPDAVAKSSALDILRECFAMETTEGGAEGAKLVKALMAEMGVDKFVKVPEAQGNALLAKATAVKAKLTGTTETPAPVSQEDEGEPEPEAEEAGEVELAF